MNLVSAASTATSSTATVFQATCTAAEQVGNAVYVSSSGAVRRADASALATARVVGLIKSKSSTTACEVQCSGELGGLANLVAGTTYFAAETPGALSSTPGSVMVVVGEALTATSLLIRLEDAENIA